MIQYTQVLTKKANPAKSCPTESRRLRPWGGVKVKVAAALLLIFAAISCAYCTAQTFRLVYKLGEIHEMVSKP